jgi:hypothetical protein
VQGVHRGEAIARPSDQPALGDRGRLCFAARSAVRIGRYGKAFPVPGDGLFNVFSNVVPRVPAVGNLGGQRCSVGRSLGIGTGSIAADDTAAGMLA